jgi:hypothetical protein
MNDDFEKEFLRMPGALRRPDPTLAWKADILARARREAGARRRPPWLLVAGWTAAWTAIVMLTAATPRNVDRSRNPNFAEAGADRKQVAVALDGWSSGTPTLVAFGRQENLWNDLR